MRRSWRLLPSSAAAALAAAITVGLAPVALGAPAETGAVVDTVKVDDDTVTFTVAVPTAAVGTKLDPARTSVSLGGASSVATAVAPGDVAPPSVVLVFDASGSMKGEPLRLARTAAHRFLDALPAGVQVSLVTFSSDVDVRVPLTADLNRVHAAVDDVRAAGETALYDAVATAAQIPAQNRTIVVLSDGGDTASAQDLPSAISKVTGGRSRVEAIAFTTGEFDMAPLASLATAGKGEVRTADDGDALAAAFLQAAASLSTRLQVTAVIPEGVGGSVPITVGVSDGSTTWTGSAAAQLPAATAVPPPAAPAGSPRPAPLPTEVVDAGSSWMYWIIGAAVLAVVLLIALAAAPTGSSDRDRRAAALQAYTLTGAGPVVPQESVGPGQVMQGVLGVSERVVEARGTAAGTALKLDRAGMALRPHEWLAVRVGIVVALSAVLMLLTGWFFRSVLIGGLIGWLGTLMYLRWRQGRRVRAFSDSLPDVLQLVASSVQTGFSLPQALDAAQQHGQQPIAGELGRALAAARIGVDLEDELDHIGTRMSSEDWKWAVMAIRIQRQVGGNLAETLLTTVRTLRDRAATRRQVRALSAEGRLSAYILMALPIGVFGFLFLIRREYLSALWTTPLGLVMSGFAIVMMLLGYFWMTRVVKVEA